MRTLGLLLLTAVFLFTACDSRRGRGGGSPRIGAPKIRDASGDDTGSDTTGEPMDGGADDAGFTPPDTGAADSATRSDSGTPDTGTPDSGVPACRVNTDCSGPSAVCLTNDLDFCNGASGCGCAQSCDPYSSSNSCGAMVCTWLGDAPANPLGVCLPDQGGAAHGQSCNTQYDAQGNLTSDTCNRTRNMICWGASPQNPIGVCTTICGTNNPALCGSFGNYTCDDLGAPERGYGVCLEPPPSYTDVGSSCTSPSTCQGSFCSQTLAGSCSSMCAGLANCPSGTYCLDLPQEGPACALGCTHDGTTGDDPFCRNRNPNTVCENLGSTTPIGICIPACQDSQQCGTGSTCVDGHCT